MPGSKRHTVVSGKIIAASSNLLGASSWWPVAPAKRHRPVSNGKINGFSANRQNTHIMAQTVTIRRAKPVLAYLVTEDWYFLSHRLPMAREAQRAGYDVHVVTHVNKGAPAIEAEGFRLPSWVWRGGRLNPPHFIFK